MKLLVLCLAAGLTGCAATPQEMARESNIEICRFTMGGPHSRVADAEARARGLDCTAYYPAIAARMQAQNAATSNFLKAIQPPPAQRPNAPVNCTSYRYGNQIQTTCN